jgi:hypothetical protein
MGVLHMLPLHFVGPLADVCVQSEEEEYAWHP